MVYVDTALAPALRVLLVRIHSPPGLASTIVRTYAGSSAQFAWDHGNPNTSSLCVAIMSSAPLNPLPVMWTPITMLAKDSALLG